MFSSGSQALSTESPHRKFTMFRILVHMFLVGGCFSQIRDINFSANPSNVAESVGMVTFALRTATGNVVTDVVIEVTQLPTTTAAAGHDFGGSGTYTVTILNGASTANLIIAINNDLLVEPAETIQLEIKTIVSGMGTVGTGMNTASTTINPDGTDMAKVRVDFAEPVYVTNEPTNVNVVLRFTDPNKQLTVLNGMATASLSLPAVNSKDTADAGAAPAADFINPTTTPISFPFDKTTTELTQAITINADTTVEPTEVFHLSLGAFTPNTYVELGTAQPVTQIRIRDDDVQTLTCVGKPEINRRSKANLELYAFTSLTADRASIAWSKTNLKKASFGSLTNQGTHGKKLGVARPKRSGRRFGAYTFTATGATNMAALSCTAFVRTKSDVLMSPAAVARKYTMIIYPSALASTVLCPKVTIGVDFDLTNTRQKLRWTKDGKPIKKWTRCFRTVSTTAAAGVYIISRDNRGKAWFAIIELKLAECPQGQYKKGAACTACPECFNGGICSLTGTCICPPCFEGRQCDLVATDVGGFGEGTRFTCAANIPKGDATCKGLLFNYGGIYGSSCACGWSGSDCSKACKVGTFGADCSQTCHCMTPARCNIRTGVCSDRVCATGYSGDTCQKN